MTRRGAVRVALDEPLATRDLHRRRTAPREDLAGRPGDRRVRLRRAGRARRGPALVDRERGRRRLPGPALVRPERRRRRVGGERDDDRHAAATAGRLEQLRADERLDEDVDRPAAGEADVPCLLVADPVPDDPGDAVDARVPDLLDRGTLDAAARHRPGEPSVGRGDEARPLGPRRGPERAYHDGPTQLGALVLPGPDLVEQLLHPRPLPYGRSGRAAAGSTAMPVPAREGSPNTCGATAVIERRPKPAASTR